MKNRILTFIDKLKIRLITFTLTNRQFLAFIIILMLETMILEITTLGMGTWGFKSWFFNFGDLSFTPL